MNQKIQGRKSMFSSEEKSLQRKSLLIETPKKRISNSGYQQKEKSIKIDLITSSKCLTNKVNNIKKQKILISQKYPNRSSDSKLQQHIWEESLIKLGAIIVEQLDEHTDYLIWHNGSKTTQNDAKALGITQVNPIWIEEYYYEYSSCMKYRRLVSPERYPINEDQKESESQIEDKMIRDIENLQLWELDPNDEQLNTKQKELVNKKLQEFSEKTLVAFHKSVDRSLKKAFEIEKKHPYDKYKNFNGFTDEISMLGCDIMVIDKTKLQYDLTFCIACLYKRKIVSQDWLKGLVDDLEEHILQYELPNGLFIGHKINLSYSSQIDKKTIILLNHLERLIKYLGGEIETEHDCDIFLYLNPSCHNKIKIRRESQMIVHAKWFFESIQEKKVLDMKKYYLQNV